MYIIPVVFALVTLLGWWLFKPKPTNFAVQEIVHGVTQKSAVLSAQPKSYFSPSSGMKIYLAQKPTLWERVQEKFKFS